MTVDALVPVKDFARAKERLRPLLGADDRAALARVMFLDVLDTLNNTTGLRRVWVVSASADVLALAAMQGASPIAEPPGTRGLNQALHAGRTAITANEPPASLLVVPADVPAANHISLADFISASGAEPLVRVCPALDGGTNALLLRPPDAIPFRFGRNSAARHLDEAEMRGLLAEVMRLPEMEVDLDKPSDLWRWLSLRPSGRTAELLSRLVERSQGSAHQP